MKSVQKVLSVVLAGAMIAASATACGSSSSSTAAASGTGTSSSSSDYLNLKVGESNKDIKADLKVLTNRTDIVDTKLKQYAAEFKKLYPNVNIKFEGVTNYADDVTTRLSTKDWGDICKIPSSVDKNEFADHFISYGSTDELGKKYRFVTDKSYDGQCYGIASVGNAQGIVYNKKVFKEAGITTMPKTPDEFIKDLQTIKTKTSGKVIPLYTNFAAKWTMGAWDSYIGVNATGDATFMNQKLAETKNPFAKASFTEGTGPYAVYNILYTAVKDKLTESDPTTTDWESSKTKLNNGQIATMVLGSWAVNQCKTSGKTPDDVGYMPFPITVNGKQYTSIGNDYCYGINKNATKDNQTASLLFVKWITEKSNYAYNEGCIPIVKTDKLPSILSEIEKTTMLEDTPAVKGKEDEFTQVNRDSELSLKDDNKHVQDIVEAAQKGSKTLDQIVSDWNTKWSDAQKNDNIEVK